MNNRLYIWQQYGRQECYYPNCLNACTLVAMLSPMITHKLISTILVWTLIIFFACSTTTKKTFQSDPINQDTVYSVSTKQLKSDKIPDSVFQMTNLQRLEIAGEDCDTQQFDKEGANVAQCWMITEIPSQIKNLQKLITLRLTLNAIKTIPNELTELKDLKLLDLTDNAGLENVDNLAKMENIKYLLLYGCGLTKLPDSISNLKNLKELGLVSNNLDNAEKTRLRKVLPNCITKF